MKRRVFILSLLHLLVVTSVFGVAHGQRGGGHGDQNH